MGRNLSKYGVIFDFNGTLYWDTHIQNVSWDKYLEFQGIQLNEAEKKEYIHGRNGKDSFEYIFKKSFSPMEIEKLTEDKEVIYRSECLKHPMEFAPGALSLLDFLSEMKAKLSIATASGKANVDFFIEKFNLLKYFRYENIIYNDGSIRGKPFPDLFINAIKKMNIHKDHTIVFEDSISGIEAAVKAGVGNIIIVDSNNENFDEFPYPKIIHFDEFDRNLITT